MDADRMGEDPPHGAAGERPVAPLRSGVARDHGDHTLWRSRAEPLEHVPAQSVGNGGTGGEIPGELDPRRRLVGVLATGAAAGVEAPAQLLGGDHETPADADWGSGHARSRAAARSPIPLTFPPELWQPIVPSWRR